MIADNLALAGWLIFIIGWTDWIDGYLARRLNQVSELGKALDPIADRMMIASAVVGGLIVGALPWVIGYPLIARELFMAAVTVNLARRGGAPLVVRILGKRSTFLLYGAIPAFFLAKAGIAEALLRPMAWTAGVLGLVLYWLVALAYLTDARRNIAAVKSPRDA